jgi:predicted metal-binding protein
LPYIEIKLADIIFDPKVQTYCVSPNFKCPSYGHSWACPPVAPYFKEKISKFSRFYLIYYRLNLNDYVKKEKVRHPKLSEIELKNKMLIGILLRNKLEKEINAFLAENHENQDEKCVLWDGYCRVCSNAVDKGCNYDSGEPCRYPDKRQYSMEAVGIDVTKMVQKLNLNIEWPPTNYVYRFGLVCFK